MSEINRSALIVRPREPFLDWVRSPDEQSKELTPDDIRRDASIYLIPELFDDADEQLVLEWCYAHVFEAELESWYLDEELWPRNRDLKCFLNGLK